MSDINRTFIDENENSCQTEKQNKDCDIEMTDVLIHCSEYPKYFIAF